MLQRIKLTRALPILLLAIAALFGPALLQTAPAAANPFKISLSDERTIGEDMYKELQKQDKLEKGTARLDKLQEIGDQIVERAELETFDDYTFSIVDEDQVNAFATPGGYVYIYAGLWDLMSHDEDMIAAVVAHELIHTENRHAKDNYEDQIQTRLGLSVLLGALGASEDWWRAAGLGTDLVFLKYSRDQEEEADGEGIRILYEGGYDPYGMSRAMNALEHASEGGAPPEFLSSHPSPGNRVERSQELAAELVAERNSQPESTDRKTADS